MDCLGVLAYVSPKNSDDGIDENSERRLKVPIRNYGHKDKNAACEEDRIIWRIQKNITKVLERRGEAGS